MKLNDWLTQATFQLKKANIGTARLDSLVLLEDATSKDRAWLLAHPEITVKDSILVKLNRQLMRRVNHEPLAYIRGKSEFYGREFIISYDVLEPRPESETMIVLLNKLIKSERQTTSNTYILADIGTGSGALAITAKLENPLVKVLAADIDPKCLKVAQKNAKKHKADIEFFAGNLLEPLVYSHQTIHAILANLPYVPHDFTINNSAMHEPKIAIFGGKDGLEIYRLLFSQISKNYQGSKKPRYVLTESLPFQHQKLREIAQESKYKLDTTDDFIQLFELA